MDSINIAKQMIADAKRIVAFTGAGVSTESGLADFRSPGGLWTRYRIITHSEFISSSKARNEYWSMRAELIPLILAARPNEGHNALVKLEKAGKLIAVITQNIDGLHQLAGSEHVIELHGTNRTASCLSCHNQWPIEDILHRLEDGERDLHCFKCNGLIDPDTVSFGQAMPENAMSAAYEAVEMCDLIFMLGSSLDVQPAASFPVLAHQHGAKVIFINRSETPYDGIADLVVREPIGVFLSKLL